MKSTAEYTVPSMTVTEAVAQCQHYGIENCKEAFEIVFEKVVEKVAVQAHFFAQRKEFTNMSIDESDLSSFVTYEWLSRYIRDYDPQFNSFEQFFFCNSKKGMHNATQKYRTERANNMNPVYYDGHVYDEDGEDCGEGTADNMIQPEPDEDYSERFTAIMEDFAGMYSTVDADIIRCFSAGSKEQQTADICHLLHINHYDTNSRKQVSRAKKRFELFYLNRTAKRSQTA